MAIGNISFNLNKSAWDITATRLSKKTHDEIIETHSDNFILIDDKNQCVNLFSYFSEDAKERTGVSVGKFFKRGNDKFVNNYTGHISLYDENKSLVQEGHRIDILEVEGYMKIHGDEWIKKYIEHKSESYKLHESIKG